MKIKETTKSVSPHAEINLRPMSKPRELFVSKSEWIDYSEAFSGGIVLDLPNIFGYKV